MTDIKNIELFLLDMDGTIFYENELIPGASDFFQLLNERGIQYAFMTNNSSKGKKIYVEKLRGVNIEATERNIVSSINVTINYLKKNYPQDVKIFLVGTDSFRAELEEEGFEIVPVDYRTPDVGIVLLGFDTELNYKKLEGACYYLSRGYDYIATNCDLRCPIKDGKYIPDCGAIAKMIEFATERVPRFLGKPECGIINISSEIFNVPVDKILCIGDRLYTDIAVGINAGAKTALVFTGEAKPSDLKETPFKPTYSFPSIKELYDELK